MFEEPAREPIIALEQAKAYAEDATRIAAAVQSLEAHAGWKIFLTLLDQKEEEMRAQDDYDSLEAFRVDRKAFKLVHDLIAEFANFAEDAEGATALFTKLTGDSQTSPTTVALSTGGNTEG